MNATPGQAPVKSLMPSWVRGPQDFIGGIALMAIALFALWASSDLQGMRGFSFGAGTAPADVRISAAGLGAGVTAVGILTEGAHLAKYHWRGPCLFRWRSCRLPSRSGRWA
jgi:putative tricarboxylic transport membrane protein